jgi:hypothetical protein
MINDDKKRFSVLMMGLAENFSAKLTTDGIKFRFEALKAYSIEDIEKASLKILKKQTYNTMPNVACFIEAIEGSTEGKAHRQVIIVLDALKHGDYTCSFNDPITAILMSTRWDIKTWGRTVLQDELDKWWPKDFIVAYKNMEQIEDQLSIECTQDTKKLLENIGEKID